MKKIFMLVVSGIIMNAPVVAQEMDKSMHAPMMNSTMHSSMHSSMHSGMQQMEPVNDKRISLGLGPQMKQQQLANMRSHVEAVHDIIGLLAVDKFDEASAIAHNKLGLTPEMKKMCNMFSNADFSKLGLAFHKQADKLGDVLKTHDMKRSLSALHTTMDSCVRCHASFRQ